jgi:c-di-GMP-binding flagellar brake protein YcgR
MSVENRKHPRYLVEIAAEITIGPNVWAGAAQNISEGGVGLVIEHALEEGATIGVTLFLTQDGIEDPDQEPFEVHAQVSWCAPRDEGTHVAGVRFAPLSPAQRAHLQRFIAALAE